MWGLRKYGPDRQSEVVNHKLEELEPRVLLSAVLADTVETVAPRAVTADWFARVNAPVNYIEGDLSGLLNKKGKINKKALKQVRKTAQHQVLFDGQWTATVKNQWIVSLSQSGLESVASVAQVASVLNLDGLGARVIKGLGLEGMVLIETDGAMDSRTFVETMRESNSVRFIEPNRIEAAPKAIPNDPFFKRRQWGLFNSGRKNAVRNVDIGAPAAWDIATGDPSVVIGVIDSGIKYNHVDLAANMWINPGETDGDGIDDDGNGYVDDIYGYDFINGVSDPHGNLNGHGTHVAGTIGAVGNNGIGVSGVAWQVKLMALKIFDYAGRTTEAAIVEAIDYATMMRNNGVNIVATNNSWGGGPSSQPIFDAIEAHGLAGILFVAAAGNDASNNDFVPSFPNGYELDNIISVGALNRRNKIASFSNYGTATVDIFAPGAQIFSTWIQGRYRAISGTSMASPHVAGLAALIASANPALTYSEIRDAILGGAELMPNAGAQAVTGGRINAYRSLLIATGDPLPDVYAGNTSVAIVDDPKANSPANLGLLTGVRTLNSLNMVGSSTDVFKFEMNSTGDAASEVTIDFLHADGDLNLAVYESDGTTLVGSSTGTGDGETVSLDGIAAGTYFVVVTQVGGGAGNPSYTMTIDPGLMLLDAYESNDDAATVDLLTRGAAFSSNLGMLSNRSVIRDLNTLDGSDDWFRFETGHVPVSKKARISIQFTDSLGDLDLYLWQAEDPDDPTELTLVQASASYSDNEGFSIQGLPIGTYFLQVSAYNSTANPNYTLIIDGPMPPPDIAGDSIARAYVIKSRDLFTTTEYVGHQDQYDYYLINNDRPRLVQIDLTDLTGNADMMLVNVPGGFEAESVATGTDDEQIITIIDRGRYLLIVNAATTDTAFYTLTWTTLAG